MAPEDFQQLDPGAMSVRDLYACMIRAIVPRPIAWVSTCDAAGNRNLAPFSYFNGVCSSPPTIAFSVTNRSDGTQKDTVNNIESIAEFVVNVVPASLAQPMFETATEFPADVDEFDVAHLVGMPSRLVRPPRVALSPIQMECRLDRIVRVGQGPFAGNLILGQILLLHVRHDILDDRGKIDPAALDAIGRMGGLEYTRTRDRFRMSNP